MREICFEEARYIFIRYPGTCLIMWTLKMKADMSQVLVFTIQYLMHYAPYILLTPGIHRVIFSPPHTKVKAFIVL